ncbi:MAG: 4Fe-4S binding protein, partial [Kiritimatiellota bacterium]|nr:4Fe-4S binding protein [Kiritimatiellota bacterium]
MKRTILTIDESKCNGCGICVTACAEGALKIVDGKARLVSDRFCDGFGDCVGDCPTGALKVETREADDYDAAATRDHVRQEKGITGLKEFEAAAQRHSVPDPHQDTEHKGCPGSRMRWSPAATGAAIITPTPIGESGIGQAIRSDLTQWPVQLHLVPADAPFFKGHELVVLSTCSPVASADAHWR